MGEEKLTSGELILGETLKIGYFSQNIELIDAEIRVIDYIKEEVNIIETLDGNITASELLEQFLFDSQLQYSKVKMLSGGEKRRLQLVRVLAKNPNLLILDEPTNDLDVYTIEMLENYLENFIGPILVVSHDRYFLDKICNKLFVYENGKINEYNLLFSEFLNLNKNIDNKNGQNTTNSRPKKNKLPTNIRNEYNKINEDLPNLEVQLAKLKNDLSIQTTDYHKMLEIQAEIDKVENSIDSYINRLFELEEIKKNYEN